jgi:antitoxin component YwqK of YwqJK toxin-antitoxin module
MMLLLRVGPRLAVLLMLLVLAGACTRKVVSFNSQLDQPLLNGAPAPGDTLTTTNRKGQPKLSTAGRKAVLTKEEERAAKEAEKAAQRKPNTKKKLFLGERIKKGYFKTGQGKSQVITVFYYLKTFRQPSGMAPAVYYYSPRKHKIFTASGELDPTTDKVLHGPIKRMQGTQVIETGYYAMGTKHLRWERFDSKGNLLVKSHYEMGYPRDANISYYDGGNTMVKEVVPYVNGKLEGDYAKFTADGKREWTGHFENGRRVGEWTNYWDYKGYRHYVFQYGDSGYEPEVAEPELIREYSHGGSPIYDKDKNLDKRGEPEPTGSPNRPGARPVGTAPRPPVRKAQERRPGYHPKATVPGVTPPAVPASPTPTAPAN